jgi:hypothetical protein
MGMKTPASLTRWGNIDLPQLPENYYWDTIEDALSLYFDHGWERPIQAQHELVAFIENKKHTRVVYQGIGSALMKTVFEGSREEAVKILFSRLLLGEWT